MGGVLPSWNETPTRSAIIGFVERVTTGADAVPVEERIAVFDNDGTLWTEKPMPTEMFFVLGRLAAMAEADPALRDRQPWKAAHENDHAWLSEVFVKHYGGDDADLKVLMGGFVAAFAGVDVDSYGTSAAEFVKTTHPALNRAYAACAYQPMVELLRYLEEHGFTVFIASGGNRDFMRGFAADVYSLPPERIIGSSNELAYTENEDGGSVVYQERPDIFDDGPAKPVRIWSRIGRRPLVVGGNSNGDVPMLRWAGGADRSGLRLLVLHDDVEREFDYVHGAEKALEAAKSDGWTVISVKDDWSTVFVDPGS
ncbi:MAG TPA: HAD family hydrolase [Candidatus Limnocylindria bacterium]